MSIYIISLQRYNFFLKYAKISIYFNKNLLLSVFFVTLKGKTAAGVLARAQKQHIPVIAIGGCVELCDSVMQMGFACIYPILEEKVPLQVAMQRELAMSNVTKTIARILKK